MEAIKERSCCWFRKRCPLMASPNWTVTGPSFLIRMDPANVALVAPNGSLVYRRAFEILDTNGIVGWLVPPPHDVANNIPIESKLYEQQLLMSAPRFLSSCVHRLFTPKAPTSFMREIPASGNLPHRINTFIVPRRALRFQSANVAHGESV